LVEKKGGGIKRSFEPGYEEAKKMRGVGSIGREKQVV